MFVNLALQVGIPEESPRVRPEQPEHFFLESVCQGEKALSIDAFPGRGGKEC